MSLCLRRSAASLKLFHPSRCLATSARILADSKEEHESGSGDDQKKSKTTFKVRSNRTGPPGSLRIYTRTGDGGNSSLFTGERRPKSDHTFDALGTIDELSSHLGLAREFALDQEHPFADQLQRVQCLLQDIGSNVATPHSSATEVHVTKAPEFDATHVTELEEWIDQYSKHLPPLRNFILPGGGKVSASLHICRAVCRRAERRVAPLVEIRDVDIDVLKYLNRLSDFLFVLARYATQVDKNEETIYKKQE